MQQRTGAATDHRAGTRQDAVATTTMLMFAVSVALAMMGHVVFVAAGADDIVATTATTTAAAAAVVAVAVPACSFPNTSMVSFESCPHFEGETMVSQMELCLPFLLDEETTPSADCCGSVSNVSSGLPACFCKVTFYPPRMVNITQQKRLASFCNVTTDLCATCPQYLVNRTYTRPDWMDRPFWNARGGPRFHLGQYNKKKLLLLLLYQLKLFFFVLFSKLMPFPISSLQAPLLAIGSFIYKLVLWNLLFLSPSSSFWKNQLPAASQLQSFLQTSADQLWCSWACLQWSSFDFLFLLLLFFESDFFSRDEWVQYWCLDCFVLANWFLAVAKVAEYKTTAIWLAVLLALTYVGIAATAAFVVHKRWKAKKAAAAALLENKMSVFPSANLTHPGSDF